MSTMERTGWVGWGRFAAVIILVSGIFGVLQGIVAIFSPDGYFIISRGGLFLFDLTGWGWWTLILSILLLITGGALLTGATWARVVAVILAILSAVGQLLLLPAQPWWSAIIIAVDVLVIFALTVHGREMRPDGSAS
ncbi:hypothetical protein [Leifsonia sp. NPDC058230]|uniref:DUF7144 family membrane protein n=1 Tax=Leifsonia sp. NPDC058230 TaxID=3346391 RepID=UPI0036DE2E97